MASISAHPAETSADQPTRSLSIGTLDNDIPAHRFFHVVDARHWHQVETFHRYRDISLSAQRHADIYMANLKHISVHGGAPEPLRKIASELVKHFKNDEFVDKFLKSTDKVGEKRAAHGVRSMIFGVTENANTPPGTKPLKRLDSTTIVLSVVFIRSVIFIRSVVFIRSIVFIRSVVFIYSVFLVNGEKNIIYPHPWPTMLSVHKLLFQLAVESLKMYEAQHSKERDILLVKDAQYTNILTEKEIRQLLRRLQQDWGNIGAEYPGEDTLPAVVDIEDRTLQVLMQLCKFVIRPHFGKKAPSENDILMLWVSVFSLLTKNITMHTGEKVMLASKAVRQMQSSEFGDPSDCGRKADCLFMFGEIELSNIEFKRDNIDETEIRVQNRKNVRLGRCLQESQAAYGVEAPSVLMADVAGYTGVVYQVAQMGDVAVAGKATPHIVQLPSTEGGLLEFMTSPSLAILWNFMVSFSEACPFETL
ncbi:hypothetical protein EC957_002019 [Mortierella hygrophila]|uniref:Uncharacterized protein n=1 Tax=Mortierella hygrophila TaxID=979708 RepID=A0A9P6K701_9FUNG|nr:hypothetical protein EC957_002019 [Mortierella hygrophila]